MLRHLPSAWNRIRMMRDGWAMLGRSYINLEKYSEASNAYAKADELKKNDPDLLVEYAFAMAMANGRQASGQTYGVDQTGATDRTGKSQSAAAGGHRGV